MTTKQIRSALRNAFGDRKYRITGTGDIHVYGRMPNSIVTGWYLYGHVDSPETIQRIEQL